MGQDTRPLSLNRDQSETKETTGKALTPIGLVGASIGLLACGQSPGNGGAMPGMDHGSGSSAPGAWSGGNSEGSPGGDA